jgi:hypothetical protein
MSVRIYLDYKLIDGTEKISVSFFTQYFPTYETEHIRHRVHEVVLAVSEGLAEPEPRSFYVRDSWILKAIQFRPTGTEVWLDL